MGVLQRFERRLEGMVEGAFARAFKSELEPVEIASADKARHRLSRSGDRQLSSVLHTSAVVQIRMPKSPGHAYYQRKLSEGKTPKEAKRCLKRRLADHVRRTMITDERRVKSLPGPAT